MHNKIRHLKKLANIMSELVLLFVVIVVVVVVVLVPERGPPVQGL